MESAIDIIYDLKLMNELNNINIIDFLKKLIDYCTTDSISKLEYEDQTVYITTKLQQTFNQLLLSKEFNEFIFTLIKKGINIEIVSKYGYLTVIKNFKNKLSFNIDEQTKQAQMCISLKPINRQLFSILEKYNKQIVVLKQMNNSFENIGYKLLKLKTRVQKRDIHNNFKIIPYEELTLPEKEILSMSEEILSLVGYNLNDYEIIISENPIDNGISLFGQCIYDDRKIIINRDLLKDINKFSGILIHEFVHAIDLLYDETIPFENKLCEHIGQLCRIILTQRKNN